MRRIRLILTNTNLQHCFRQRSRLEIRATGGGGGGGGGSNRNVVQVIDPKRANNGGIILAGFKIDYGKMAKAVNEMYVLSVAAFRFRISFFALSSS